MQKIVIALAIISLLAGFVLMTLKVDTQDAGGITGTIVVKPDTPPETITQTRNTLRSVGVIWLGLGFLGLAWARSKRARSR